MKIYRMSTILVLAISAFFILSFSNSHAQDFKEVKKGLNDIRALSDLKIAAVAQNGSYELDKVYVTCKNKECEEKLGSLGFVLSAGVNLELKASESGFTGRSHHDEGTGKVFTWDSNKGGLQQ